MTDVAYSQSIQITSTNNTNPATQVDFQIFPAEVFNTALYNESVSSRYIVPASASGVVQGMGTVATASVFVITPAQDIQVVFVNGVGPTPPLTFLGGRTSILHMNFTGFSFSNPNAAVAKGRYYLLGV